MSKLYLVKIYLLIENNQYLLADKTAQEALDYVYLNELKRTVYKFTFVRAQLADLIDKTGTGKEKKLNNSVLALRQFLDRRYDNEKNILREIYVAIELYVKIPMINSQRNYLILITKLTVVCGTLFAIIKKKVNFPGQAIFVLMTYNSL